MFDAKASQPNVEIDLTICGIIIRKINSDMKFKGCVRHVSSEAPQYLIKRDKTEQIGIHKALLSG